MPANCAMMTSPPIRTVTGFAHLAADHGGPGPALDYTLPPYSLTVLRIPDR
jgi:hypothetical protein